MAGIANLVIKEEDLKETLELLAERLQLPTGAATCSWITQNPGRISISVAAEAMASHT